MNKIKSFWKLTLAAAIVVGAIAIHLVANVDLTAASTECRPARCLCLRPFATTHSAPAIWGDWRPPMATARSAAR